MNTERKVVGIYHRADLDGLACAAIMKHKYPQIQLIGYDYGQDDTPLFEAAKDADLLMMADVSLPMDRMNKLALIPKEFHWIDHHRSAMEDFVKDGDDLNIMATLKEGVSACELTWKALFPDRTVPHPIWLLGRYDTWRIDDDRVNVTWEDTLDFQFGMCVPNRYKIDYIESELMRNNWPMVSSIRVEGGIIRQYLKYAQAKAAEQAYEYDFMGHPAIVLNTYDFNSGAFDSVYDPEKHHIMLAYRDYGEFYKVSLYTTRDDVDCSVIAKSMGGGGHRKAAGFQVQKTDVNAWF